MQKSSGLLFYLYLTIVVHFFSLNASSQKIKIHWQKLANGVWRTSVGKPEKNNLLTASGVLPKTMAINKMPLTSFPLAENEIKVEVYDGKTYLRFPLDQNEKIFGLCNKSVLTLFKGT